MIPCDIPTSNYDLDALWHHLPSNILPPDWSCDWTNYKDSFDFMPNRHIEGNRLSTRHLMSVTENVSSLLIAERVIWDDMYDMGEVDFTLMANYGVALRVRGVMYCIKKQDTEDEVHMIILQDALGDYYLYSEDVHLGTFFVAKFRVPRGTAPEIFAKDYFKGAVKGVDMDEVHPGEDYDSPKCQEFRDEQEELGRLRIKAQSQSVCACANKHSNHGMIGKSKFVR
jgi:hypothetical protein